MNQISLSIENFPAGIPTTFDLTDANISKKSSENSVWWWKTAQFVYKVAKYIFYGYVVARILKTDFLNHLLDGRVSNQRFFTIAASHFLGIPVIKTIRGYIENFFDSRIEEATEWLGFFSNVDQTKDDTLQRYLQTVQNKLSSLSKELSRSSDIKTINKYAGWKALNDILNCTQEKQKLESLTAQKWIFQPVTLSSLSPPSQKALNSSQGLSKEKLDSEKALQPENLLIRE